MMVVHKGMDVTQEAQDYLAQFSITNPGPPQSVDTNLESMLDTWTREKYKSKGFGKKSSSRHVSLPKEWDKVQRTLGTAFEYNSSHLEYMADNILYPENNEVEEDTEYQQDTYMNEEAFLEQLLQEDTKPNKQQRSSKQSSPKSQKFSVLKHSLKKHSKVKKSLFEQQQENILPDHTKKINFVAGQHVSNESRQAVLRRGVCKDEIVPPGHTSVKSKNPHNSYIIGKQQQLQNLPLRDSELRNQYGALLEDVENNSFQNYTPTVTHLEPICQKCGWTLTATMEEVMPEVINVRGSHNKSSKNTTGSNNSSSLHSADENCSSSNTENVTLQHSKSSSLSPSSKWLDQSRSRTVSNSSSSTQHLSLNTSHVVETHSGSKTLPSTKQHRNGIYHHHHNHNLNNHQNYQERQFPSSLSSLTTSKHCHSRASQTDPNLLNQDLSPFAEVSTIGSDSSNVNLKGGSVNNRNIARGSFTKAKPPSGRQVKADIGVGGAGMSAGGNLDEGIEAVPVIEAAKNGNVESLKQILTTDSEQSKVHDVQGNSLLHISAERGHLPCVQYLAEKYPFLCEQENKGKFTPATLTIKTGHVDVLEWLLENTQAKDEILPVSNKKSLLHHAAKFGQDPCLRAVLEKMNPLDRNNSCCDSNGNSPAHVAAKHGHLLCLQSLVEYGVDATKANKYGHSPCYYADFSNHRLCAGYLMVVETCLNLAKKLIRLERSMEQLSNSLAKYSDNPNGEVTLTYDYNADRSSATSSVEDDGTRDEAWQLLCRKFEEASKRLVVFRTQNRALRPVRPTKLALLALAQTKEETQAAMSVINKLKTSSTNNLVDDVSQGDLVNTLEESRSKSFPDLVSAVRDEYDILSTSSGKDKRLTTSNETSESTFVLTGMPSPSKDSASSKDGNTVTSFKEFECDLHKDIHNENNKIQVIAEVHNNLHNTPSTNNNFSMDRNDYSRGRNIAKCTERKIHRRSSSVGDVIDNVTSLHKITDDLEYHLKTRVLPPSNTTTKASTSKDSCDSNNISPTSKIPPPLPPRQPPPNPSHWQFNPRGAEALPRPPPPKPPPIFIGENEQTSDFFEEITNGRYDSSDNISDIDPETLQKILDMQEEIMRCGTSYPGVSTFASARVRTPGKLELTPEDFNETYARKAPDDSEDVMDDDDFSFGNFRRRIPQTLRTRYGDTMNKSGNNSHIIDSLENIMEHQDQNLGMLAESMIDGEDNNNIADQRPWYELSDDEDTGKTNTENDEYFTLL